MMEELKKIKCDCLKNNISILSNYKKELEKHIDNKHKDFFNNHSEKNLKAKELVIKCLFSRLSKNANKDEKAKYISSQCISIITQINKFMPESDFRKIYNEYFLNDDALKEITKELIFDIRRFSYEYQLDITKDYTKRDHKINSTDFYTAAKFSYFSYKPTPLTHRNFFLANAITNIRLAIDSKIFEMIGFKIAFNNKGRPVSLKTTQLMSIFKDKYSHLFPNIPVSFEKLKILYTWSSEYIHSVEPHFVWQILHAIDILEPLFSTQDRNNDSLHTFGMSYLSKEINIEKLKDILEKETNYEIYLNEDFYRESS